MKPYINDALVGNGKLLATLNSQGELLRCLWPNVDFGQHVSRFRVKMAESTESELKPLHQMKVNRCGYEDATNVLNYTFTDGNVSVYETDFAVPNLDVLVRHYRLDGEIGEAYLAVESDFQIYEQTHYQSVRFESVAGAAVHYYRDVYIAVGASVHPIAYQVGLPGEVKNISGLNGDGIALTSSSALGFPVEDGELTLFLAFGHSLEEALEQLNTAKQRGYLDLKQAAEASAEQYLQSAKPFPNIREEMARELGLSEQLLQKAQSLYDRSILTFQLLQDRTGAMIAAPEFDEGFTRCGGYAFCWGRDAAYIVTAFEQAGMVTQARKFYEWAIEAQDASGVWEHRHYMNGQLAPSWGIQLDETAALLWGMARHIKLHSDESFRERAMPALLRAADYLIAHINPKTNLPEPSVDLWEERTAEHIYTAAATASALNIFGSILENTDASGANRYVHAARDIAHAVYESYSNRRQAFFRGRNLQVTGDKVQAIKDAGKEIAGYQDEFGYTRYAVLEDDVIDVSLLGIAVPFEVFDVLDARMQNTARAVEHHLTREVGGIGRYEDDQYIGGNPWILASLWLAIYELRRGRFQAAGEQFRWAIEHTSKFGFLPEQVDRHTGQTAWVVPLTWSHAMYVWFVHELTTRGTTRFQPTVLESLSTV